MDPYTYTPGEIQIVMAEHAFRLWFRWVKETAYPVWVLCEQGNKSIIP